MREKKTRNNRAIGTYAKTVGDDFERVIASFIAADRQKDVVGHRRHAMPTFARRFNQKTKRVEFMPVAQDGADYSGFFSRGGIPWGVEIKSTKEGRIMRNALTERQQEHLSAIADAGGVALVALEFRGSETFAGQSISRPHRFIVPWRDVPWRIARTAESVSVEAIEQNGSSDWLIDRFTKSIFTPFIKQCGSCGVITIPRGRLTCLCQGFV